MHPTEENRRDIHPLKLSYTKVWLKLAFENQQWTLKRFPRSFQILIFVFFLSPIRLLDKILYSNKIDRVVVGDTPIFILGHWRSGTTLLHTILSKDFQWGYVKSIQAFIPGIELINIHWIHKILKKKMNRRRPHDNMPRGFDVPEEEEFAISSLSTLSSLHSYWFPRNESYFKKFVLFEDITDEEKKRWKNIYLKLLKRIVFYTGNKNLILKNPPNTGRIKVLLEMFPKAKFIHIYRNPYHVFPSMLNMYKIAISPHFLQDYTESQIKERIFTWYELVMKKYFNQKSLIPKNNLIEISFEELENKPVETVKKIYDYFNISKSASSEKNIKEYINSMSTFKKNPVVLDEKTITEIKKRWMFTLKEWNYDNP